MLIAVLDTETTGLDPFLNHKIIELCIIFFDDEGNKKGQYLQRFNPGRSIDPGAQQVHGISVTSLIGKPKYAEHAVKIDKLLSKVDLIVAHNAAFDIPFLVTEGANAGIEANWSADVFCTFENARCATGNGKAPNLGEPCFAYGVNYDADEAHAADYDVKKTAECFFNGLKYGDFKLPESDVD
jgi:DNA polymerase-3 subunit epsilon